MINHIRKFLLVLVLLILGISGYNLAGKFNEVNKIKEIDLIDKEVDIEIQNFKIIHEVSGKKEWELKADLARINHEKDLAELDNVEFRLHPSQGRDFHVWADSGVFRSKAREISLEGNVKMIGEPRLLTERLNSVHPAGPVSGKPVGYQKPEIIRANKTTVDGGDK